MLVRAVLRDASKSSSSDGVIGFGNFIYFIVMIIGFISGGRGRVHMVMILAVAGGAVTHQTQVPLGSIRASDSSGGWTAVALMAGSSDDW